MKMKFVLLTIVVVFCAGAYAWPYLQMEFASSAYYSQNDKREYEYYTPDLLKKMPRISQSYTFQYISNHDSKPTLHEISFDGTTDKVKIESFLRSEGYVKQVECDTEAECWRSTAPNKVVSLYSVTSPDHVVVQITDY